MLDHQNVYQIFDEMLDDVRYIKRTSFMTSLNTFVVYWQKAFFFIKWIKEKEVEIMYQERILLTSKDILEKEFKIDTRGYRPQEGDKFLDAIIRDYEEFFEIIKEIENDKKELIEDNIRLKQEIRSLRTKLDVLREDSESDTSVGNADLLRRLSNLEKVIYGKDE